MRDFKAVFIGYVVSWVQGMRPGAFWLEGRRGSGFEFWREALSLDNSTVWRPNSSSTGGRKMKEGQLPWEVLSEFRKPRIPTCLPPRDIPARS